MSKTILSSIYIGVAVIIAAFGASNVVAAPPANDNFANAEVLTGVRVSVTRTNVDATKEAGEPNHANDVGGKSVWFKWTAPRDGIFTFSTNRSDSNIDTLLGIYVGPSVNALSGRGFNDNIFGPANNRSAFSPSVAGGTTYYIAIDGGSDSGTPASGSFTLDIKPRFNIQAADYDTDGMTDLMIFRPSDGTWRILNSATGQTTVNAWGTNGDIPMILSTSFEMNRSVYRPSDNTYYLQARCCTPDTYFKWGVSGDIPVAEMFGGDPSTPFSVFRPSTGTWFIKYTNTVVYYKFGQSGDIPVPGTYSPDMFADIAVFRPSNGVWYFLYKQSSSDAGVFGAVKFGQNGDQPVQGDYDGDGILDVAVFRPSDASWWVLRSSDGQATYFQHGQNGDIPSTGDYDGDGLFDYAVFRPSTGAWLIRRSTDGAILNRQFGQSGDIPMTANRAY